MFPSCPTNPNRAGVPFHHHHIQMPEALPVMQQPGLCPLKSCPVMVRRSLGAWSPELIFPAPPTTHGLATCWPLASVSLRKSAQLKQASCLLFSDAAENVLTGKEVCVINTHTHRPTELACTLLPHCHLFLPTQTAWRPARRLTSKQRLLGSGSTSASLLGASWKQTAFQGEHCPTMKWQVLVNQHWAFVEREQGHIASAVVDAVA